MATELQNVVPEKAATVRRLSAEGIHWRVVVESWHEQDAVIGRLVFEPDTSEPLYTARHGMPMLRGGSHSDVLMSAHDLPENRLKEILYSLQ